MTAKRLLPVLGLSIAMTIGGLAACTGGMYVSGGATVNAPPPTLVEIHPGVWVVEDYGEPVFYSDGYYWRYYGGVWYRSSYYNRGWVYVRVPPPRVRHIERPRRYVRYRARPGARVHTGRRPPARRGGAVRDHRSPRHSPATRDHRGGSRGPAVRDHRGGNSRGPAVRDHRSGGTKVERRDNRSHKKSDKKKKRKRGRDHRDR